MGTSYRFHLPNSLKRAKSSAQPQGWQQDGKEYKAQNILGITETTLNTARNQSISSSTTARLPTLSFSDATTELGSSNPPAEQAGVVRDLHLKASSVLLHEEFQLNGDAASSVRSKRLKAYNSSSTINSHYEAHNTPLAISQQTSDSSRRDFALRKGSPVVITSTTPERDSIRQLKLFRTSKGRDRTETKKHTKPFPQSPSSPSRMFFGGQRSGKSSDQVANPSVAHGHPTTTDQAVKAHKGVHFNTAPSARSANLEKAKPSRAPVPRLDESQVKVNIRRPKAGARHWFDGLEGDTSEDESVDEPELEQSFVVGMELAFEDNRIGRISRLESERPTQLKGLRIPSSHMLPDSAIPPRVSTLNAKSSRSTLSQKTSIHTSTTKHKASSLASTDLHHTSILDLSSSDDEEPRPLGRDSVDTSLPPLRDSIAVESLIDCDIELGTAKAIRTQQNASVQGPPNLRRVPGKRSRRDHRSTARSTNKHLDPRLTYLSEESSDPTLDDHELLSSFPPTPTEQSASRRPSFQDSCLSDSASLESRRLMSVTRQEESLLAAIRMKKATLNHPPGSAAAASRLGQAPQEPERQATKTQRRPPRNSSTFGAGTRFQYHHKPEPRYSIYSDGNFDQASCTTFQTGVSNDPSRYSLASFRTGTSVEPDSDISASLATASPNLLSPGTAANNRMSRSTFFSTSTNESRDDSRTRRETHYLATLERLSAVPKREDVSSQEFIDWPYHGWDARAKMATAH